MAEPELRILLMGAPAVISNGQSLQIQRRTLRWMLFYLASQREMIGRADLILIFWPDEAEEDARRHLRETLSKLRAQLPDPELILTEQDQIGLDYQRVYSDVQEFQSLVAQTARACAQTPASTPLTQAIYLKAVQAIRLWRSARFLAGATLPESEALNDWLLSFSQQVETQRAILLERLADHDIACGDIESALQRLRLALDGDETNETLHYRLLNLLHKQGRYSEALNYCTYLQELFRREGYSELPPALLSLSRNIREGASQTALDSERPTWPALADIQVPFVGQTEILQELQFAVRRGGPVILFGEAGAGKSRLVRELFFSLKPTPRLLLAPARMMENNLPFQPITDLLRHDVQAEEWQKMDSTWITPLSLLLPELAITRPEVHPPQIAPGQEHRLIFEALHRIFLSISKKRRFLFFLDNAQWSDAATLSALAYLAERGVFGEAGALILAARPEEMTPHLNSFLDRPRSSFSIKRLNLTPLQREDISILAGYVLGDALQPAIIPRLERETGGNPLFLLETLRLVQDYSFSNQLANIEYLPLASSVHAVILERIQHLPPSAAQVISLAAVIGSEFSVDLLESTSMLPPEQVVQSLEVLVQANLIKAVMQDRPSGGYIFAHEKVREVVLLDLSAARRRLLHLRIARALEQNQQGQSAEAEAVLAFHYEEAGELSSAFQHWLEAALYAWRKHEKDEAIADYHRAEQILQRLARQASDTSIYQLYRQWGRLAFDLSDAPMMEQVYNRLLQFGRDRQNPLLAGSAYNGFARMAELRMQPDEGLAHLEKAAPFLEQAGRLFEYIEAHNLRGTFFLQSARYQDAQEAFQKALTLGEKADDAQSVEARSLTEHSLAILLTVSGWPLLALEMARRSFKDADETFHRVNALHALSMQAIANSYLGRYTEGLRVAIQGLSQAEGMQFTHLAGILHGSAAHACLGLGDLDGCYQHAQQALTSIGRSRYSYLKEGMYSLLGKLFYFLGDYEESSRQHQQGSQAGYTNFHALDNHIHLALDQAASGDPKSGLEILEQAIPYARRKGLQLFQLYAEWVKSSILVDLGRFAEASSIINSVLVETQRRGLPEIEARCLLIQVKSLVRQNCFEQAALISKQVVEAAQPAEKRTNAFTNRAIEIEGYSLWLKSARRTGLAEAPTLANKLQECIQDLGQRVQTPVIRDLLIKKQATWTELPD